MYTVIEKVQRRTTICIACTVVNTLKTCLFVPSGNVIKCLMNFMFSHHMQAVLSITTKKNFPLIYIKF